MMHVPSQSLSARITFVVGYSEELQKVFPIVGYGYINGFCVKAKQSSPSNINYVFPKVEQFGTHHSKAMFLFYKDGTARIVIHTANLISRDWQGKSQACWISPILQAKSSNRISSFTYETSFAEDLTRYLEHYGNSLKDIVARLQSFDLSNIRACLISSVPGRHKKLDGKLSLYGHLRLSEILKKHVRLDDSMIRSSSIIVQVCFILVNFSIYNSFASAPVSDPLGQTINGFEENLGNL